MKPLTPLLITSMLASHVATPAWAEYKCKGVESQDGTVYVVEGDGSVARSCPAKCTRPYDTSDSTDRIQHTTSCAGRNSGETRWVPASAVYYTSSDADAAVRAKAEKDDTAAYIIGGAAAIGILACLTGVICKGKR